MPFDPRDHHPAPPPDPAPEQPPRLTKGEENLLLWSVTILVLGMLFFPISLAAFHDLIVYLRSG